MLDGYLFAVYTEQTDELGLYAMAVKIPRSENLVKHIQKCVTFNVCKNWKEALELAYQWNIDFKNNGKQFL